MPTLIDITRRRVAVKNTAKITQAMKMVSAAQLKRAQKAVESARPYAIKMEELLFNLVANMTEGYTNPLIREPKEIKNVNLIVVSSDRGLCGSFNTNLFRNVNDYIRHNFKNEYSNATLTITTVGKKATNFFTKTNHKINGKFSGVFLKLQFKSVKDIINSFKDEFAEGKFDLVMIYSNLFVNVIKQIPTLKQILPIQPPKDMAKQKSQFKADYIFEPDRKSILDELLPKYLEVQLWRTLLESNTAENAARMIAMDNATTNANELMKYLELQFNKARQAKITKEMLEIVGGAEALKKS